MEFTKVSSSCGSSNSSNNGVKLLDAATEGRADEAVELLARDPTLIHIADAMGDTALHIAARAGHGPTVLKMMEFFKLGQHEKVLEEVLLKGNADGDRPLHLALKNGHKNLAFDLAFAKKGAVLFMENDDGKNALQLAEEAGIHLSYEHVSSDNNKVVKGRYKRMAPVDIEMNVAMRSIGNENNNGDNNDDDDDDDYEKEEEFFKLYEAAETSEEDVVKKIVEHNPNILKRKCSEGRTALHVAAWSGNMGPIKMMVEVMQDDNNNLKKLLLEGDNYDNAPLHFAIEQGHEKVARYLVEVAPRAVYKENQRGDSPLILAIDKDYPDLVRYMTRDDLSQSIRDRILEHAKKVCIGHYALEKQNLATFQAIIEGLPDLINVPDNMGWKLLSYAASKGYINEVRYILKHFPDSPRKTDKDESFPIHKAIARGHISVVKEFLLHCPQALQDIDRKGRNLVEIATRYKKYDVLSYLKEINL